VIIFTGSLFVGAMNCQCECHIQIYTIRVANYQYKWQTVMEIKLKNSALPYATLNSKNWPHYAILECCSTLQLSSVNSSFKQSFSKRSWNC